MPTYKKEYSTLVEDIMTDCDIYSSDGHKYHTKRALWSTGGWQQLKECFINRLRS